MKRLAIAGALCAVVASGCGSCPAGGVYQGPRYRSFVLAVSAAQLAKLSAPVPDREWCESACDSASCQLATPFGSEQRLVVCHLYVKGGCPSPWP